MRIDFLQMTDNQEEFEEDTSLQTEVNKKICKDSSTGSVSQLPLDTPYVRNPIWVFADDRAGNTNQATALAEKLGKEYTLIKIQYNCLAKLPNLLLKYYPIHIKSNLLQGIIEKPLPDIIITAGRRTAVVAFYLKKKFKNKLRLIQIMQPNLPYNVFDFVILPYHDLVNSSLLHSSIKSKVYHTNCNRNLVKILGKYLDPRFYKDDIEYKNIIRINGALNNVTAKFKSSSLELQKHYHEPKQFIAVIIGGNNKKFNFNKEEILLFSSLLNKIYINQKIPFFISFSRRTPKVIKLVITNNMPTSTIIYNPDENQGYNPYIGMLAKAKYIISTADSISMCSEATSSGKPLYIFCPSNFHSLKHKIFIKQLVDQKIARIFDQSVTLLEEYSYTPLNEIERVAKIIRPLINN